jgi:predicted kinase
MRRRGKRGPNDSESTGKIGQELPQGQLAPLRPSYSDAPVTPPAAPAHHQVLPEPIGRFTDAPAPARPTAATASRYAEPEDSSYDDTADFPDLDDPDSDTGEDADNFADAEGNGTSTEPGPGSLVHETQPESPSTPPPAAQAASPRAPRGFVVLTIGLPGSGKTTWFKRRAVQPLSSDMLRSILFDDITEQRYQGLVFSTLRSLLRARLIAKMPWNYVDATNLSPHERRQWIKMAKSFGYDVHAVFFDVPFEVCMDRNRKRERVVAEDVMQKMAERLRPPSFKEGFSKITVVRVKGSVPSGSVAPAGEPSEVE